MHTHTVPTEKEIDFFRTQADQKAYYNWFVNVAELTHPLSWAHTVHHHTKTLALTNMHSYAISLSVLYRKVMWQWKLLKHVWVCHAAITELLFWVGILHQKREIRSPYFNKPQKHSDWDWEEGRVYRLENWDMKMILPLWGLIIVYAPGPFLSFSLPNQINHHRSPKPSLSLCSLSLFSSTSSFLHLSLSLFC